MYTFFINVSVLDGFAKQTDRSSIHFVIVSASCEIGFIELLLIESGMKEFSRFVSAEVAFERMFIDDVIIDVCLLLNN